MVVVIVVVVATAALGEVLAQLPFVVLSSQQLRRRNQLADAGNDRRSRRRRRSVGMWCEFESICCGTAASRAPRLSGAYESVKPLSDSLDCSPTVGRCCGAICIWFIGSLGRSFTASLARSTRPLRVVRKSGPNSGDTSNDANDDWLGGLPAHWSAGRHP